MRRHHSESSRVSGAGGASITSSPGTASSSLPQESIPARPSPRWIRRVAYEAEVCERTVIRFLMGEEVRPTSRERIERTLAAIEVDDAERGP